VSNNSSLPDGALPRVPVIGVQESLVTIDVSGVPIMKNEVGYILVGNERLKAEVLRVQGNTADMQVFEDTSGVKIGDEVELSGEMLSVALGPGLLAQVFDGLQMPLTALADSHGFFLPRGVEVDALDHSRKWKFEPSAKVGASLVAGQVLGTVAEGPFSHKIMVPFNELEPVEVTWIRGGSFTVEEPVARIRRADGVERELTMMQRWAIREPIPRAMIRKRLVERLYPTDPITTTQRIIDTFLPIARGGTGCIPGPFGAGKTVLQSLIARHSTIDIVIIIACGERAGEVVETIKEYPETEDPRTGRSLMDRTIIICNTSSMPVAARESSIYTGLTLAEYYRQMGFHVLCIADSTSRWAQAMRETSGRMEEIPGEEAFPAYLDSSIRNVYERAGVLRTADGDIGSVTLIGTVSPAGGNFEEPVTQATLSTVKTFLGLSSERAYRRYYPAIDPLISWSRYLGQLEGWFSEHLGDDWVAMVQEVQQLLVDGDAIYRMMQVTGEEGISLEDYVKWQKSVLVDMVYLQQDAYDKVDSSMSRERQTDSFRLLKSLVDKGYGFNDRETAREVFTKLTSLYKNWNYSAPDSAEYHRYRKDIVELAERHKGGPERRAAERAPDSEA
jgi:V/A-type H+-transporting ATPase subunit A